MQRYHTTSGTGTGIGCMVEPQHVGAQVMREDRHGHWVLNEEAQAEINKPRVNKIDELEDAYKNGYKAAQHDAAQQSKLAIESDDSDRKRLLNELYHDRARLERAVKDAADIMLRTIEYAKAYKWVDSDGELVGEDYPLMGSLQQFADTHGE